MTQNSEGSAESRRGTIRPADIREDPESRAQALSGEHDLERQTGEHWRDERTRKVIGYGSVILLITVFIIVIGAAFTLGWHMLLPDEYHWLDQGALQTVKDFILSGTVVGLGTHYIRRFFDPGYPFPGR